MFYSCYDVCCLPIKRETESLFNFIPEMKTTQHGNVSKPIATNRDAMVRTFV